ncbi:MAG: hypothetical protein JNK01_11780, partial [Devosia sp.]|nr:hypothetical protein [Devosia sp.]
DIAEFDRAKIEGLIAAGLTAQQAANTADEEMRLQEEIDGWRNLLLDASVGTSTAH